MNRICFVLLALLWAAPARASVLTFDNLWPYDGVNVTGFGVAMWTPAGESLLFYEPAGFQPVAPGASWTFELPSSLGHGFSFNWLDVGGVCPQNCGWGTNASDVRTGAWLGTELFVVNALWPSYDGGMVPVVRMTYTPDAAARASVETLATVPEPGTLALMLAGGSVLAWRKRRRQQAL